MRITGGRAGGRVIRAPRTDLRPTQDKVRAAIYSSLAEVVPGARVLDLFAGSGALGLEAWSREAAFVEWVESDRRACAGLRENLAALGVAESEGRVRQVEVERFLKSGAGAYDLVLADPPYDRHGTAGWLAVLLEQLPAVLKPGGWFVYEMAVEEKSRAVPGWRLVKDRCYGNTRVLTYWREAMERSES